MLACSVLFGVGLLAFSLLFQRFPSMLIDFGLGVAVACDLVLVLVLIVLAPQCCFSRLLGSILKKQEGPSSY